MARQPTPDDIAIQRRADEALRRALNTPPKQHKDMKKGAKGKPRGKPATRPAPKP